MSAFPLLFLSPPFLSLQHHKLMYAMNKRFTLVVIAAICSFCLAAQETKEADLPEVSITAARTTARPDGMHIIPSSQQLAHAASSYSLIKMLQLPGIRVDETLNSIQTASPEGNVQIRINDIIVSRNEMLRIDPKTIKSIDFIDAPGVRYGQGISHVICIYTHQNQQGYSLGTHLTNSLTTYNGNNNVFATYNHLRSEWNLSYNFGYQDFKKDRSQEQAQYAMADGTMRNLSRTDLDSRTRSFSNNAQLTYSLTCPERSALQIGLSLLHQQNPGTFQQQEIIDETGKYYDYKASASHSLSPELDLYYSLKWDRQSLTANANLSSIHTSTFQRMDEGGPYEYAVAGKTYSLAGEGIYENQMQHLAWTSGLNYSAVYTDNLYSGDVSAKTRFHRQETYAFSQIKGKIGRFGYVTGMGVTYLTYRQDNHHWHYWLWRPKLTTTYQIGRGTQLKYSFETSSHVSSIALISDTEFRMNSMEWKRGNPSLKPNRRYEHTMRISHDAARYSTYLEGYYRRNPHCNMETYERTADGTFVYTQRNQPGCHMYYISGYYRHELLPDRLSASVSASLYRFYNYGDTYRHHYTAGNGVASIDAYLGRWTLSAYADNGWHWTEGEHEGHQSYATYLTASYQLGACRIAVFWQHPLDGTVNSYKSKVLNEMVHKTLSQTSCDRGNMIAINFTWRLTKGRKYEPIQRQKRKGNTDNGILSAIP